MGTGSGCSWRNVAMGKQRVSPLRACELYCEGVLQAGAPVEMTVSVAQRRFAGECIAASGRQRVSLLRAW